MDSLHSVHSITIPPLQCSALLHLHPDFHTIKEETEQWLLAAFTPSSENDQKLLVQSQFPLLTCYVNAAGERRRIVSLAKFYSWLFKADDLIDDMRGLGRDLSAATLLYQSLMDTLEGKPSPPEAHKIVTLAQDWWSEICPNMPPTQRSRFLRALGGAIDTWKVQISCRKARSIPDVQTYILRRRTFSGMFIVFILAEYALGIELDEETLTSPLLFELHDVVADHVSWVNDLLSLKGEYLRGDYDNIASVVCFNESHNFQASVETVCRMIRQRDDDFVRFLNEFKRSKLWEKPGVGSYLESLGDWMAGNVYWSYLTARYHGVDANPKAIDHPLEVVLYPEERK